MAEMACGPNGPAFQRARRAAGFGPRAKSVVFAR
jgi:hypothetical protein